MSDRLVVSFSGGRTSAFMLWLILQHRERWPGGIVVVFANTGQEHEQTLLFIGRVEEWLGIEIIGLEAVPDPRHGAATGHVRVNHHTAARDGAPFERVVQKYGLPGPGYLHCTRELKARPIRSFVDGNEAFDPELDTQAACGDTCEPFADGVEDYEEDLA